MSLHNDPAEQVARLAEALLARGQWLGTAESCTGGLITAACTELAGSSAWFDGGVVSYSNEAKQDWLGVPEALLAAHGAVSEPVALAMAQGVQAGVQRHRPGAGAWTVAVTGIAGPGGGSPAKPVGTVWVAWAAPDGRVWAQVFRFEGDRAAVRRQTVSAALAGLLDALGVGASAG